jgi:hypothetical protein
MNDTVKLSRDNLTKTTDDGRIELVEEALTRVTGGTSKMSEQPLAYLKLKIDFCTED